MSWYITVVGCKGFRAEIAYSPDYEIGLVVLMNAESAVMNEITPIFLESRHSVNARRAMGTLPLRQ